MAKQVNDAACPMDVQQISAPPQPSNTYGHAVATIQTLLDCIAMLQVSKEEIRAWPDSWYNENQVQGAISDAYQQALLHNCKPLVWFEDGKWLDSRCQCAG